MLPDETDPVDIAPFSVPPPPGAGAGAADTHYMVVAGAAGSLNAYQYDSAAGRFILHHALPLAELPYDNAGCRPFPHNHEDEDEDEVAISPQ